MATFSYPTSIELREIEQEKTPVLDIANDLIFQLMPIRAVNSHYVAWEQRDNYTGLQQVRGLNGAFPRVQPKGGRRFVMEPGVYGEYYNLDERTLTERAAYGTFGQPIAIDDLVMEGQDQLLDRRLARIRWIGWTLLATGTFSVANADGTVLHTDSYTMQTYTAGVTWATSATATPLANFRATKLLGRGRGVDFGRKAMAIMNTVTANSLYANTNANDIYGWRIDNSVVMDNVGINTVLNRQNLPQIVEYDEGYWNDSNVFVPFIPNNTVILVGARPAGQTIAEYQMTRNANNDNGAPGPYTEVVETKAPKSLQVFDGHNGGPAVFYPGSIVIMTI